MTSDTVRETGISSLAGPALPGSETGSRALPPAGAVEIGLTAAVLSVSSNEPLVLSVREGAGDAATFGLPSGAFTPLGHRTLEIGLRTYVATQTSLELGYVEQLYTFGDRGRHATTGDGGLHIVSIGYLALTSYAEIGEAGISWRSWYHYFPWEDRRSGFVTSEHRRERATAYIMPRLEAWAATSPEPGAPVRPIARSDRVRMCFPDGANWDEEKVLERYELLYEAGLVEEARRDGRASGERGGDAGPGFEPTGQPMRHDHRRILATAIGRIRGKIKYRPVIFELLPDEFTLFELQRTVEAILGPHLHKQNFRRLVEAGGLVEPTGDVKTATGGRPARLYRFRREVLLERPAPGVRVNPGR
ncbi:MAG: NAD regulator [Hyphomicrobiaceae bacterium]|nr:NAD regulator [Hyphomicrobiaceae bacterium]